MAEGMKNKLPGALFTNVAKSPPLTGKLLISCYKGNSPNCCSPRNWGPQEYAYFPYWERSFLWSALCNTWIAFHTHRKEINWLYSHFAPDQNNTINHNALSGMWMWTVVPGSGVSQQLFNIICKENACLELPLQSHSVHCPWEEHTSHIALLPLTVLWF